MRRRTSSLQEATILLFPATPSIAALGLAAVASLFLIAKPTPIASNPARIDVTTPKPVAQRPAPPVYAIKSILPSAKLNHGGWTWDETAAPAAGPVMLTIDTASQTLTVFRGGHAIGVAVIVYGDEQKPTPLGDFKIIWKKANHWSSLYDAPMPYTLRLTNDGISVHGSEEIAADLASHGCVGLPLPFARKLFANSSVGDPVRITHGQFVKPGALLPLG